MADERALRIHDFPVTRHMVTRWADNDMYGHLNNAVYYQLFDAAINGWIIDTVGIDPVTSAVRNVVVESGCRYFSSVAFPEPVTIGIGVARLGSTSVTYDLGVFGAADTIMARGRWVHVYVDTPTGTPHAIPSDIRTVLTSALVTLDN